MKKVLSFIKKIAIVLSVIIVLAAAFIVGSYFLSAHTDILPDCGITSVSNDRATNIVIEFDDIAELATKEYSFSGVGEYESHRQICGHDIIFTGKSFLASYVATIKAGISDVSDIDYTINDRTDTIRVSVPDVEILDAYIDPDTIETHDESHNVLNQISVDDVASFASSRIDEATQEAIDSGILDMSRDRVEEIITDYISDAAEGTVYENYEVEIDWN